MAKRRVVLGGEAERDFIAIIRWTSETFGAAQARTYRDTLKAALSALAASADPTDSKGREDIGEGLRTLHVARRRRRGRHLLLYRRHQNEVVVLRILHDSMELSQHLPANDAR